MKRPPKKRSLWMLSFGDLLTLLLCLFVARYEVVKASGTSTYRNHKGNNEKSEMTEGGTHIAKSMMRISHPEVHFGGADFIPESGKLTDKAMRELDLLEIPKGYSMKAVTMLLCSEAHGQRGWKVAEQRALSTRRQLLDTGVRAENLKFEVLGTDCSLINKQHANDIEAVARFELRRDADAEMKRY